MYPDRAGKAEVTRVTAHDCFLPDNVFQGSASITSHALTLEQHEARFARIEDLRVADITYGFNKVGDGFRVTAKIPLNQDAIWYTVFGLSEKQIERIEAIDRAFGKEESEKIFLTGGKPLGISAVFSIQMPGLVIRSQLNTKALKGWTLKTESGLGNRGEKRIAVLSVPLRDILSHRSREVLWTVESGPCTVEATKEWDKFKAKKK